MVHEKVSTVYFLVGIPGSGKSTWAAKKGLPVLSSDTMRKELTGSESNFSKDAEVFEELGRKAEKFLAEGEDFIYDATNTHYKRREKLIDWHKIFGAKICGVLFMVPKEIAKERNISRERKVPNDTIERMWQNFIDTPIDTSKDWFDEIVAVDEDGKETQLYRFEKEKRLVGDRKEVIISPEEFTPKNRK